jgi:hypothetical protein
VPVHHRQGGQHHRVPGEAADLGAALDGLRQLAGVFGSAVRVLRKQRFGPPPQKRFDGLRLERGDVPVLEAGQNRLARVSLWPGGDYEAAPGVGARRVLEELGELLAFGAVGRFIQAVQQHQAAATEQAPEQLLAGSPAEFAALLAEEVGQPRRRRGIGGSRGGPGGQVTPDVLVQVGDADEQRRRRGQQGFFHRLAEGFARQVKGDAAQEGRFARAGIADDHEPRMFQRFLEGDGSTRAGFGPVRLPGGGELHVEVLNGEALRFAGAHLQAADIDPGCLLAEPLKIAARAGRLRRRRGEFGVALAPFGKSFVDLAAEVFGVVKAARTPRLSSQALNSPRLSTRAWTSPATSASLP